MNIALFAYEFYPMKGGIAEVLTSTCKAFHKNKTNLFVFNRHYASKDCFDILDDNTYSLKDTILLLKQKDLMRILFKAIWKILFDKKLSWSSKIFVLIYYFIHPNILIKTLRNISHVNPYFKRLKIDLIFGGASGANTLPLVFLLSKLFNKKVISLAHGNEFLVESKLSLKTHLLKNVNKILVSNNINKEIIKKIHHLDDNLVHTINFGLNLKDYEIKDSKKELREKLGIPMNAFIILSVGRHISRKKFDLIIKSLKKIKDLDNEYKIFFYLIGKGPETNNLRSLTTKLNLEKYVKFLGYCDNTTRNMYYKLSDLFIMPSVAEKHDIEGFGVVFLEANYYKLPVIGSLCGGMVESIANGKSGLLIKPNSLDDLTDKILFFYNNKDVRKRMGDYGHKRVVAEYNWDEIIDTYICIFEELNS